MIAPKSRVGRGMRRLAAGLGLAVAGAGVASAQPHTPDPYRPYNNQFDSFVYPIAPDNPALPGQARLRSQSPYTGGSRANQLDQYFDEDEVEGIGSSRVRSGGIGQPYYQAGRRSYSADQSYIPNRKTDGDFYQNQGERDELFFRAIRERDPKKRSQLMQQVERLSSRTARSAAPKSTARTTSAATPARRSAPAAGGVTRPGTKPDQDSAATRPPSATTNGPEIPPAPPMFPGADRSSRSTPRNGAVPPAPSLLRSRAEAAPRPAATPSEILERSRRLGPSATGPAEPR